MRLKNLLTAIILLIIFVNAAAFSQFGTTADRVGISHYLSVDNIHPGANFYAAVKLDIDYTWHINAHIPTFDYLIGTKLEMRDHDYFENHGIQYPEAKQYSFAFAGDQILDVYSDVVFIYLSIGADENVTTGEYTLTGNLTMQACDNEVCIAPSTVRIDIPVTVVNLGTPVRQINQDIFTDDAIGELKGQAALPLRR